MTTFLPAGKLPLPLLQRLLAGHVVDDPAVLVGPGIGKDAAVIEVDDELIVLKTDPITFAVDSAPAYLVHVNANDLACMGARPRWLLVTALLPAGQATEQMAQTLFQELQQACESVNVQLVGGHTEITTGLERPMLVGMLVGTVAKNNLMAPGMARPGDRLLLTKGLAIEGTALLARERREELIGAIGLEATERAAVLLVNPGISVLPEANLLNRVNGVHAMHDPTEGGLATAVLELGSVSNCGALIGRSNLNILPETAQVASHFKIDPLGMVASGALLAAVDPAAVDMVSSTLHEAGIPFAWIGKLVPPEHGFRIVDEGIDSPLPQFSSDEVTRALASNASTLEGAGT